MRCNQLIYSTSSTPFGMLMDGRHFENTNEGYRYGFQGQEKDNEVKGDGNSLNYKYRMHDARVGRFFAVDPLSRDYPHYTPYSFSGNKLIAHVELEGLEELHYKVLQEDGTWGNAQINGKDYVQIINDLDENVNVYLYSYPNGGVKKSVYKSLEQGGKDRWEFKGGTAPSDLLRTHYAHDQYGPTDQDRINSTPYDPWAGPENAPFAGVSVSASTEVNTPVSGVGASSTLSETSPSKVKVESETHTNVLFVSTSPRPVDASAQVGLDFEKTKGTGNNAYTTEAEVSYNFSIVSISLYKNSDGGSGLRFSFGVSTTKTGVPVTGTVKTQKNF